MADDPLSELAVVLPPLFRSLEGLEFVARHFDPPDFASVMAAIGAPEADLPAALGRLAAWPDELEPIGAALAGAIRAVLAGFEGLRSASELRDAFRALGQLPRAQEALYPLAEGMAPVSRYFLEPPARRDEAVQARAAEARPGSGVFHLENERSRRGGVSIYAPGHEPPERGWPLVVALHGGSGHGRAFLWSWLRAARTAGAVLASPTAVGESWALNGPDLDTPNLAGVLDLVAARWPIDRTRMLLTGMSDGGSFAYLAGLTSDLPFTHLAPVSAAFHPMLTAFADPARLKGLPIRIVHGARDWMFPVETARSAYEALSAAGAAVSYRELADLSHAYPREENLPILQWMAETAG